MKKTLSILAIAGLVLALAPVAQAAIALPDPGVVGPYRVIFVTSANPPVAAGTQPGDTNMAALNSWVDGLAVASGLDTAAGSPGWSVLGATTAVDVYTNTGLSDTGGFPVYKVNGDLFAADNAAMWGFGGLLFNTNEDGNDVRWNGTGSWTHTGLIPDAGLPITAAGKELDSPAPSMGGQDPGYNPWYGMGATWGGDINSGALVAISGVIVPVIPEPATMSVLVIGGIAMLRRKRR